MLFIGRFRKVANDPIVQGAGALNIIGKGSHEDCRNHVTGIELYRHLCDAGHAIPTILVTAFPNDVQRARALNDGVVCYLSKSADEQHLKRCLHAALTSRE